jgi:hypothetical protein
MQIRFAGAISDMASRQIFAVRGEMEGGTADFATAPYSARSPVIDARQESSVFSNAMIWHFNSGSTVRAVAGIDLAENDWRTNIGCAAGARAGTPVRHAAPFTDYNGVKRHIEFVGNGV